MDKKYTEEELLLVTQIAYYNFDIDVIAQLTQENGGNPPTLQRLLQYDKALFDSKQEGTIYEKFCVPKPEKINDPYEIEKTKVAGERYESIKEGEKCQNWSLVDYHNENASTGMVSCLIDTGDKGAIVGFRGSESDDIQKGFWDWIVSDIGLLNSHETVQQHAAEKYMQYVADYYGDKYDYLATSGHSLGGALSFHATLTAPRKLWEKIVQSYSYDGPGTSQEYNITHLDYIKRMAEHPDVMQHRGWSWVGTLLNSLPCANYKWLQVSDKMNIAGLMNYLFKHDACSILPNEDGSLTTTAKKLDVVASAFSTISKRADFSSLNPAAFSFLILEKLGDFLAESKKSKARELTEKALAEHDFENEQKIAEYLLEHTGNETPEYLVRGALLYCRCGTHSRRLNLSQCHGIYVGAHPLIHEWNCKEGEGENITSFGVCKSPSPPETETISYVKDIPRGPGGDQIGEAPDGVDTGHKCIPCIVGTEWQHTYSKTRIVDNGELDSGDREKIIKGRGKPHGRSTVTTLSFLICKFGGLIECYNSGQQYNDEEESAANHE